MIKTNVSYKVEGYMNRWSVIAEYKEWVLLENETYGDETFYLVVSKNADVIDKVYKNKKGDRLIIPTIMRVLDETFDDLVSSLETLDLI